MGIKLKAIVISVSSSQIKGTKETKDQNNRKNTLSVPTQYLIGLLRTNTQFLAHVLIDVAPNCFSVAPSQQYEHSRSPPRRCFPPSLGKMS
mmetsp:Transcript_29621/g.58696  ORF Transcript_29621/g.58696 Transcript_29621/m.58696 type:complete len:91 (-) Transcript_29621:2647-2919(-)